MSTHQTFMERCIDLARLGSSHVAPNPIVGALLVHRGRIISEGYHHRFGSDHAEVDCIKNCEDQDKIPESTLYVTLEPCSFHGKTPPCADLIVRKGIKNVVIGCTDPNPKVSGNGTAVLKAAGINVIEGVLEQECVALNPYFNHFHTYRTPFVTLKWAQTQDCFIGKDDGSNTQSRKISGSQTDIWVHQLRAEHQVIVVGSQTILSDNPRLDTRLFPGKSPQIVILSPNTSIPPNAKILHASTMPIVFSKPGTAQPKGVEKVEIKKNAIDELLQLAQEREWQSILVEGGAHTHSHFIKSKVYNRVIRITNEKALWNSGIKAPEFSHSDMVSYFIEQDKIEDLKL